MGERSTLVCSFALARMATTFSIPHGYRLLNVGEHHGWMRPQNRNRGVPGRVWVGGVPSLHTGAAKSFDLRMNYRRGGRSESNEICFSLTPPA